MPKKKKQIYCFRCCEEHNIDEFTPFERNPNLKDREGRVIWCRKECNDYVNKKGNTFEALREVLRMVDIPYVERVAKTAMKVYKEKIKKTNIVTRKNVYTGKEEVSKETNKLQTTIYSCYTSKMSLMIPKEYINFSYSDGIRGVDIPDVVKKEKEKVTDKEREVRRAENKLINKFGEDIYMNKDKLAKAIRYFMDSLSLNSNSTNARQEKFRYKNTIITLIEGGVLEKKDYDWMTKDKSELPPDEQDKIYSAEWKGMYTELDIEYLNEYLSGLKRDFKIITINHLDYARKIAKASLHMDKCFDEMLNGSVGAEKRYKEARETFDTLSKSAQFSENSRGQNDVSLGCFGKVFEKVENHNWIPEWESLEKDDIDKLLDQFGNIEKSL